MTSSDYWWWTGVKEGTFRRGAHHGNSSARIQLFAADRRTSHGSRKKKHSDTQRKCLRKQKHNITVRDLLRFLTSSRRFHSTLVRNTRGFTRGWTMGPGPSAAWFYEGQLRLHQNWNYRLKPIFGRNSLIRPCAVWCLFHFTVEAPLSALARGPYLRTR